MRSTSSPPTLSGAEVAADTDSWTCPSCGRARSEKYCATCGERRPTLHDLTIRGLLEQAFESLTHVDGRILRTARDLVFHPGLLTSSYLRGERKKYIGPFQLFLIVNVLFFATQSLAGLNTFSARLGAIQYLFGPAVGWLIEQRLSAIGTTRDAFAAVYDHAAAVNAKSFIILMVMPFAAATWALFTRSGRPSLTHVIFAFHCDAFLILVACIVTLVEGLIETAVGRWSTTWDNAIAGMGLLAYAVYLYAAVFSVYHAAGISRLLKVAALVIATAVIWIGYRFVVFLITLYTTTM